MPVNGDLRRKLSDADIAGIRAQYAYGMTQKALAKQYRVTFQAIAYWTNPSNRDRIIRYAKRYHRRRYRDDPLYRLQTIKTMQRYNRRGPVSQRATGS